MHKNKYTNVVMIDKAYRKGKENTIATFVPSYIYVASYTIYSYIQLIRNAITNANTLF